MNQPTFANMGGSRPQPVNQQAGGMQRNGGTSTDIPTQVLNILQSQPVPPGWQQIVPLQQRATVIHQMVTGLRMVKPEMTLQYAISVAAGFEMRQFSISPDQETYTQSYRQKLEEIKQTRQSQANLQQQQFRNQQVAPVGLTPQQMQVQAQAQARGMMSNQNQFQQGFGMPQPPQPGQTLAMPMQQPLSQNQRITQNGNAAQMQQQLQNGHPVPNIARNRPLNRGQQQFIPEESQQIQHIFNQMLTRLTDQDKMNISRRLSTSVPPEQHQAMQAAGFDPIQAYIKNQAIHTFMNEKQKRLQLAGPGFAPSANAGMSSQTRATAQTPARPQQQPHPQQMQQPPESSFGLGNMEQFVRQQQEGLGHQAAGQDVVPASTAPPHMRATSNQQSQGHIGPNGRMQPPNLFQPQTQWKGSQTQQPNVMQTPQKPIHPPTPNFANLPPHASQSQTLQGQLEGLGNNRGQRTPQQNHNMPTLNQPMDPPKNDSAQRPPQSTPRQAQRNVPLNNTQANVNQPGQPTPILQGPFAKLPIKIQQQLASMPEEQRKPFLAEMYRKQQLQKERSKQIAAQAAGTSQNGPQPGSQSTPIGMKAGQASLSQAGSIAGSAGPPPVDIPFAKANGQQQGQPDSNRPGPPRIALNEAQVNYMDAQNFPPAIINRNNSLGQLPENVKTWRQLKEYVHRGGQKLPAGSMQNVIHLQSVHMQQMLATQKRMQQLPVAPLGNPPLGQTGQAPQAPSMIPPQANQQGTVQPPNFPIPVLPQPTLKDINTARATLPSNMKGLPDTQLRGMIMHRRFMEFVKGNQHRLNPQQLQQIAQRYGIPQLQRTNAFGAPGQGQPAPVQPQRSQGQSSQVTQQQGQPQQAPQKQAASQPKQQPPSRQNNVQKGIKRNTTDEVVEVPDPKTQQQSRPPVAVSNLPLVNGMPQMNKETFARLTPEQKLQVQTRVQEAKNAQRARAGLNGQSIPGQQSAAPVNLGTLRKNGAITAPDTAFEELKEEVARDTPLRAAVPMSPKTRNQMVEKLKDNIPLMVQRMDQSLPIFFQISKNKPQTKELLRMRLILLRQAHDPSFLAPVDNFTMTLAELEDCKVRMHSYFGFMMKTFSGPQAASAPQAPPGQPQQLNASNLQQHQAHLTAARVASAQQKNQGANNSRTPAAPTTTHAPFPFGAQSPQGIPQIYAGKAELTQEQLKLPQAKKRKPNASASSTPVQNVNTPVTKASPVAKVESPEMQRASIVPDMIKCPVLDCESGKAGFSSKEELERHRKEMHEPKEPAITDPLDAAAYAIESLRIALNLDENGKSKPIDDKTAIQAPAMKTTASSQGQNVKQETSTPMSRNPTQTGPSPSSNLLKTPQAGTSVKTVMSEPKLGVKDKASSSVKPATPVANDPWASSHVKPEWFKEVFSDCANLNRSVPDDFIAEWLDRNPFTPPTTPSSGVVNSKDSTRKSDISANDDLNINVVGDDEDDGWVLPDNWNNLTLQSDLEPLDMAGMAELMDTGWDAEAGGKGGEEGEEMLRSGSGAGTGKKQRDPMEPSDEWLKAWAPDKYEEKMKKREAQRKR